MNTLPLTFLAPLIGYLLLSFSRGKFSENTSAAIGVGSMGVSASATALAILGFNVVMPTEEPESLQTLRAQSAGSTRNMPPCPDPAIHFFEFGV